MDERTVYSHPAFAPIPCALRPGIFEGERPVSLPELLFLPLEAVARVSIEYSNLLCSTMLPDTANLDIRACLRTLDEWASYVQQETDRCMYRFRRDPGDYYHSEAYFRVLVMITALQRDLGVRYGEESKGTRRFLHSGEGFIHGLLTGKGKGTCCNMPVLYAAVGRKLHYPIYLCLAKGHVFCRWQSATRRERFNIEASGIGLTTPDDEHYKKWPRPASEREVYAGHFLRNLDPIEELGLFMATRGHCLQDQGHLLDAVVAFAHAHRLAPTDPHHFAFLLAAINSEMRARSEGKIPCSYREAEVFNRDDCPKLVRFVLGDNFPRVGSAPGGAPPAGRIEPKP